MSGNPNNIFLNFWQFRFSDTETELDYQKMKDVKLNYYKKTILFSLLVKSVICSILISFFIEHFNTNNVTKYGFISCYCTSILYLIFSLVGWKCLNNHNHNNHNNHNTSLRWMLYIIYFLKSLFINSTRNIILNYSNTNIIFLNLAYFIELNCRLMWTSYYLLSFYETLVVNFLSLCTLFSIVPYITPKEENLKGFDDLRMYASILIFVSSFCYVLERQLRISFYYSWTAEKKAKWLSNVLNNMNSGFVSFKSDKIAFINIFLLKHLKDFKLQSSRLTSRKEYRNNTLNNERTNSEVAIFVEKSERDYTKTNTPKISNYDNYSEINDTSQNKEISENLFQLLSNDQIVCKYMTEFLFKLKNSNNHTERKNLYEIFTSSISQIPDIQNFKLIGDITLETDETAVSFEIHCRYIYFNTEKQGELEFLFNDVTRTKLKEKQNAEFKYKSLFLSKVAHEFKNPLICIAELIEQSQAQIPHNSNLKNSLCQVKSLSDFLLVLVKDLNHFSEYQQGQKSISTEKETDLNELLDFCRNITNCLIMKCGKQNSLNFAVEIEQTDCEIIPKIIITDEWRLKQVLINLLSNSVKFSMAGQITLIVSSSSDKLGEKKLTFYVKDNGLGMKGEFSKNLFKPFNKGNFKYNEMGSGLGLSIVKDIVSKLGSELKFESQFNQGSSFWFSIALKKGNSDLILERPGNDKSLEMSLDKSLDQSMQTRVLQDYVLKKRRVKSRNNTVVYCGLFDKCNNLAIDELNNTRNHNKSPGTKFSRFKLKALTRKLESDDDNSSHKEFILNCKETKTDTKETDLIVNKLQNNIDMKSFIQEFPILDLNKSAGQKVLNLQFNTFNINTNNMTIQQLIESKQILPNKNECVNILVADDEVLTRQSTKRILQNVSKSLKMEINIIEAEDGLETMFLVYKCISQGIKLSMIISDENMRFMYGSRSAEILEEIVSKNRIAEIPFYLLTAYDNTLIEKYVSSSISQILTKPLTKLSARNLLLKAKESFM